MKEFKLGDKVRVLKGWDHRDVGQIGRVICESAMGVIGVEFDDEIGYHGCQLAIGGYRFGGRGKSKHCNWYDRNKLELVEKASTKETVKKYRCVGKRDHDGFTVGKVYELKNNTIINDNGFNFRHKCPDMIEWLKPWYDFEEVDDTLLTISIRVEGNKTIATMIKNGKVVKEAIAKCNPEDKFDLASGSKLALERLFEKKDKTKPVKKDGVFEVGDRVVIGDECEIKALSGMHGKILKVNDCNWRGWTAVRVDDMNNYCHTCCGLCESGHGYWVKPEWLKHE